MNAIDFILLYYDKLQKRLVNIKKNKCPDVGNL
jgi:hypothetical protein